MAVRCLHFFSCRVRCSWVVDTSFFTLTRWFCRVLSRRCQRRAADALAIEERIILRRGRRIRAEEVLAIAHRGAAGSHMVLSSELSNRFFSNCFVSRAVGAEEETDMKLNRLGISIENIVWAPAACRWAMANTSSASIPRHLRRMMRSSFTTASDTRCWHRGDSMRQTKPAAPLEDDAVIAYDSVEIIPTPAVHNRPLPIQAIYCSRGVHSCGILPNHSCPTHGRVTAITTSPPTNTYSLPPA